MAQDTKVFHVGESTIQDRADVPSSHIEMVSKFVRPEMPAQHREFFESLPVLYMGFLDTQGRVWASPVFGETGFMTSPDARRLNVAATPVLAKELDLNIGVGAKVGAVGLELHTRRRNRMNGTLAQGQSGQLSITVDQSFGNCPKYIQARTFDWTQSQRLQPKPRKLAAFDQDAKTLINNADTFFIASRVKSTSDAPDQGVDASHRGGKPGFLGLNKDGTLSFPDFYGNRFFNTLGNIHDDGRVGLFIPDFVTGAALFVTGRASIDWVSDRIGAFEGAERVVDVVPDEIWYATQAIPKQTAFHDSSPVLDGTGTWKDAHASSLKSDGYRGFRITSTQKESDVITSFYLKPADGGPIETHVAGQFLPIRFPSSDGPVMRSYTISQAANSREYRISVKREDHGTASRIAHDNLQINDMIQVASPTGGFVLDDSDQPIVFLSAGVGITPMMAMLDGQVAALTHGQKPRDVWFIHAAANSKTAAFQADLKALEQKYSWLHLHTIFSAPLETDVLGRTHDATGHITLNTLKTLLPFDAYQFYLCGPEGFMQAMYRSLRDSGIDPSHIHYEFFGAGTLCDDDKVPAIEDMPEYADISFDRSSVTARWTPKDGTLLELSEGAGLTPEFSCRSGKCGTCAAKLIKGDVQYSTKPSITPPDGHVLTCCAVPGSTAPIILDL